MSWIRFRNRHLLTINFSLAAALVLYGIRRDFAWHLLLVVWLLLALRFERMAKFQQLLLVRVGRINSTLILTLFYFLFFAPYGLLYRCFFRKPAFQQRASTFEEKRKIGSFDRPF